MKQYIIQYGILPVLLLSATYSMSFAQGENWREVSSMLSPRFWSRSCVVDDKIYILGGITRFYNNITNHETVTVYDPYTASWDTCADMPYASNAMTSAAVNGKIYSYTTGTSDSGSTSITEVYDIENDVWEPGNSVPTFRRFAASCVLNDKIYVIGGLGGEQVNVALDVVERFDPSTGVWDTCHNLNISRGGLTVDVVNGKIYAIGGVKGNGIGIPAVEEYDPVNDVWIEKMNMPTGRFFHASTVLKGNIYVMGGSKLDNGPPQSSVEVYDPGTDLWYEAEAADDLPAARCGLNAETVNNRIYVFGGTVKDPDYRTVPEVIEFDAPVVRLKGKNFLDVTDTLIAKIYEDCKVYFAPEGTPETLDSIIYYSILSFDAEASQEFKIPLGNIPLGTYLVYGVALDLRVDRGPILIRLVRNAKPPKLEFEHDSVLQGDTLYLVSDKNSTIYLVIEGTTPENIFIQSTRIKDSIQVIAGSQTGFPTLDLFPKDYLVYAKDEFGLFSEAYRVTVGEVVVIRNDRTSAYGINLFPNPATDLLTIQTLQPARALVEISSINGQLVYSGMMNGTNQQIDLTSFQKGIYFITIRSEDFVTTRKIIKL